MTKRLLDHNPLTGVSTFFDYDRIDDKMLITEVQDVTPIIEAAKLRRNDDNYSRDGIKGDMWHYARLPMSIILEMKTNHGVDVMAPKPDWKRIMRLINTEYPVFKTTTGHHG